MTALMQEQAWFGDAVCAQTDPEAWFPEKGGSTREAKAICGTCEVRTQCLQWALDNDERFGVYGGLSERERRHLKQTSDTHVTPAQEPTMTTSQTQEQEPRSYGQTYVGGGEGHRPIPLATDISVRPAHTPKTPRPTGLDWAKHTAPDTATADPSKLDTRRCRWCRQVTNQNDLVDDICQTCRDDVAAQFTPPTVGGVNATPAAVQHSGGEGPKDAHEATILSVAGDTCAPDQEENPEEEWEHVEELPPYILDIAILMRDTEGHPAPAVRAARKVVANGLVGLNKALAAVRNLQVVVPAPAPVPQPRAPRGHRVNEDQIVRLYEAGCSIPALAKELGHSKNTIRQVLLDNQVQLRDDRRTNSGGNNRIEAYPDQLVADVRRLYLNEEKSQTEVAHEVGVSVKVVQNVMAKHDIPARAPAHKGNSGRRGVVNNSRLITARIAALGVTTADIRAWAAQRGHDCPSRGTVPSHLVDQYEAAHTTTSQENA